jgi:hypothetical protein
MSKQKAFPLQLDFYVLFYLGTSGCPSGDGDRGLTGPCFSLLRRRPTKKSPGNERRNRSIFYVQVLQPTYMVLLYLQFPPNHKRVAVGWWGGRGALLLYISKSNTNTCIILLLLFYFTDYKMLCSYSGHRKFIPRKKFMLRHFRHWFKAL